MSVTLIVNGLPFEYPENGEQQPWGEAATSWAVEVTKVLNAINGPSDILETLATIENNQSIPVEIPDFFFDSNVVRSFSVRGNLYRSYKTYDGGGTLLSINLEASEEFLLIGLFQGVSGWVLQQEGVGEAGVSFSITSTGQIKYTSTNLSNAGTYEGIIKFRGVGLLNN